MSSWRAYATAGSFAENAPRSLAFKKAVAWMKNGSGLFDYSDETTKATRCRVVRAYLHQEHIEIRGKHVVEQHVSTKKIKKVAHHEIWDEQERAFVVGSRAGEDGNGEVGRL